MWGPVLKSPGVSRGGWGSKNSNQAIFAHPLFPDAAVFVGKLSDHLSLCLFGEAHEGVGITKIPDGHVANFKLASGLAFAAADGLDLNSRGSHLLWLGGGSSRLRCTNSSASVTAPATTWRPVHNPSRLRARLLATRSALNCRPAGSRRSQHLEHSGPRAPVWVMPQAGQVARCAGGNRPAWRSR